jgi:Tol biopolymer transport system component
MVILRRMARLMPALVIVSVALVGLAQAMGAAVRGGELVYISGDFSGSLRGNVIVHLADIRHTISLQVTRENAFGDAVPLWSPDGQQIAFIRHGALYLMSADWHELRNLSSDYGLKFPVTATLSWSSDGSRIIALTGHGTYILGTAGDYLQPLTTPVEMNRPVWTADGRIGFMINHGDIHRYYVMNGDSSNAHQIAATTAPYYSFAWSPAGSQVAIVVGSEGNLAIELVNLEGQTTKLVDGLTSSVDMSWSPDGRQILFTSDGVICTINADGSNFRSLTPDRQGIEAVWSPDGRQIAIESYWDYGPDSVGHHIYLMNADGSDLHRLTQDRFQESGPLWRP